MDIQENIQGWTKERDYMRRCDNDIEGKTSRNCKEKAAHGAAIVAVKSQSEGQAEDERIH